MSILDLIGEESVWNEFWKYKLSLACPKRFTKELRRFIDEKRYLPVCDRIGSGEGFSLPEKSVISKMGSDKKRVVYTYPEDENTVLKLMTHLMLKKYDHLFCEGLYSFRPGRTAKDAVRHILRSGKISEMYAYKADIHDYFNSIPVEKLLPMLEGALSDDKRLYGFISQLLTRPEVLSRGRVITERKGIMAGTPPSSFCANLFLNELDRYFVDKGVIYARYSDDIILFTPTREETAACAEYIKGFLSERSLEINPSKEHFYLPGEAFDFLGFSCEKDKIDIAPATLLKLKQKMRRKRDALVRWSRRNDVSPEKAASAFIRIFNRKLLENAGDNELSWSKWFFPVISTTESLHVIDQYAQDCLRYIISGRHTKARFNVRYEDLKKLGYRPLVGEYYAYNTK